MKKFNKFKIITALAAVPLISLFFYPVASSAAGPVINQGTTTSYAVLAGSAITNTGSSVISGTAGSDIGVSTGSSIGGFPPGTSGTRHSNDASSIAAQSALVTALSGVNAPVATPIAADLNSQVLTAGTYNTASGAFLLNGGGNVTFNAQGDPNAVFLIQAASTFTSSTNSTMVLENGAQACNIYWSIGSAATLAGGSLFLGHLYAHTSITLVTGATVHGNLLAQIGAVTLDSNNIVNNSCAPAVVATPTPTPTPVVTPVPTGTIHVIKMVVNGYGGTATAADFSLSLRHHGVDVLGSPDVGMASPGRTYVLAPGSYVVAEAASSTFPNYISSFSVVGQATNVINLLSGGDLTVIETNTELPPLVVATTPPVPTTPPVVVKTVTGGTLPKTASPWYNMLLLSAGLVLLGGFGVYFGKSVRHNHK